MFGIKRRIKEIYLRKKGIKLGKNIEIGKNVNFGSEPYLIELKDNVRVSSNVNFITHDGGLWTLRKMKLLEDADYFGKIIVEENVNIGMNVAIMPGVKIGKNSVIGFGAVVTKDVDEGTVVAGVPAKKIETIEEYYEKKKNKCDFTKSMNRKEKKKYLLRKDFN
jgi:protein capG